METFSLNFRASARRATMNGRAYLVAPLTLIVPGVLNGSKGPLLYPMEEVARDPTVWNNVPIVVYHPTRNGAHVSARDPDVLDKQGIGVVLRSQVKNKLVAEGWFDVEATRRIDNRVLKALEAGQKIELSTGLFTENEPAAGTHNGRPYVAIARNYRPDHLAILPDQVGACSVSDGCGVMVNQWSPLVANCSCGGTCRSCAEPKRRKVRNAVVNPAQGWSEVANCGESMMAGDADDGSYGAVEHQVRRAFREAHPQTFDPVDGRPIPGPHVVAVFDDSLVYRDGDSLRRVGWREEGGKYAIDGDWEEVKKQVEYVVANGGWEPVDNW